MNDIIIEDILMLWGWPLIKILAVLWVTWLVVTLAPKAMRYFFKFDHTSATTPFTLFINALSLPLTWVCWVTGITVVLEIFLSSIKYPFLLEKVNFVSIAIISFIFIWFVSRLITNIEKFYLNLSSVTNSLGSLPIDKTSILAIGKAARIALYITSLLIILPAMGISVTGLLAFGGFGGIVIGFATKDLFANILGGVTLFTQRPFAIYDFISSTEKDIEGQVMHIGWRITTIQRFDKRIMYVPNGVFSSISIINTSRRTHRRVELSLGVRFNDFNVLPQICEKLQEMVQQHQKIDLSQPNFVGLVNIGLSSLDCMIWFFTFECSRVGFLQLQQEIMLEALNIISQHGAYAAYPTTTVYLKS